MSISSKKPVMQHDWIVNLDNFISYIRNKEGFLDVVKKYIDFSQNQQLWWEVRQISGLGKSILLEGWTNEEVYREARGIDLSAEVFKAVQTGMLDNSIIAGQCGCTVEKVVEIQKKFGI